MTRIRMDWRTFTFTAEGHTGTGPHGQNILCAGISALTMAILNTLLEEQEKRHAEVSWSMDEASGSIAIHAQPVNEYRTRIRDYFEVIMTGLRALEQHNGEHMRITEVERDGDV